MMDKKSLMTDTHSSMVFKLTNGFLLVASMVLSVLTFIAIQDILLALVAPLVLNSEDATVQNKYTIVTIRNVWVLFGGTLLLAYLVTGIEYHAKRLDQERVRRILLYTLLVEIILIGLSVII